MHDQRLPGAVTSKPDLGEPVTLAEATRQVDFAPRLPDGLGPPDEVYLAPAGGVTGVPLL